MENISVPIERKRFEIMNQKVIDVTYEELVAKINASALIPFMHYRITDFQTVYYLITGVYMNVWLLPLTINSGPIEKLIVQAISSNTLKPETYSEEYPEDIIYYDWNNENFRDDYSLTNSIEEYIYYENQN